MTDQDLESPPEGWPAWMARQLADSIYVLVVCGARYRRRFEGRELAGVGKGVKWEGAIITQELYELEGKNERFIPVVFSDSDLSNIPSLLAGQTHYNVNVTERYRRLIGRLTPSASALRRDGTGKRPAEPSLFDHLRTGHMAVSGDKIEILRFILQLCENGLPIEVLAGAIDVHLSDLGRAFANDDAGVVRQQDGHWKLDAFSVLPEPAGIINNVARALEGLLAYICRHRVDTIARMQVSNAIRLADRAIKGRPKSVAPLFSALERLLKSRGDKQLVLKAANLSVEASRRDPLRTSAEVKAEARALVCGRAWVMQRIERLQEAEAAIQEARALASDVGCDETVAHTAKCLGRLRRLQAEHTLVADDRAKLLRESTNLLRDSIDRFQGISGYGPDHIATADCFLLLGRTEFYAGNIPAADSACREAIRILIDDRTKEWADLQILLGDIRANSNKNAALGYYDKVISRTEPDDATESEIMARAYFQRGIALKGLGRMGQAVEDFRTASAIWRKLKDPLASKAEWAEIWATGCVDQQFVEALRSERFAVRVRAAQIHKDRVAGRRHSFIAQRSGLTASYLEQLRREAREAVAVEEAWWYEDGS